MWIDQIYIYIYPKFYALAKQYLGIVANSVLAKSLCSKLENTIREKETVWVVIVIKINYF